MTAEEMTTADIMGAVLEIFPKATIGQDSEGQVIIYTDFQILTSEDNPSIASGDDVWVSFEEVENKKNHVTQFEQEYGADRELATRILVDPFKAPEQQAMAREYLESLDD